MGRKLVIINDISFCLPHEHAAILDTTYWLVSSSLFPKAFKKKVGRYYQTHQETLVDTNTKNSNEEIEALKFQICTMKSLDLILDVAFPEF